MPGQPEAPCDIQVEPGPQDGTLLVTWVPVISNLTVNTTTPITGYAVYADGKKVTDVDSPTGGQIDLSELNENMRIKSTFCFALFTLFSGDHALIDINKLIGLNPKQVTVRTKSRDAQSLDSPPVTIPQHMLRGKVYSKVILLKIYFIILMCCLDCTRPWAC